MGITLTEAAKLVGITKNGLSKAIAKGKISATKDDNGVWKVEPVELYRVYPPAKTVSDTKEETVSGSTTNDNKALEREIELLRERLAHADENNAKLMKMLDEQISTVRLLTAPKTEEKQQPGFWARLFG